MTISAPFKLLHNWESIWEQTPECRWGAFPILWVTTWNKRLWREKSRRTKLKNTWWHSTSCRIMWLHILLVLDLVKYSMRRKLSKTYRQHLNQWSNNLCIRNINPNKMFCNMIRKVDSLNSTDFPKWPNQLLLWLLMLILRIGLSNKMNLLISQTSKDWSRRPKQMTLMQLN